MVLWPTVTLLGFLVLTGLVIAMGIQSTRRYEAEKEAAAMSQPLGAGDAIGAPAVL